MAQRSCCKTRFWNGRIHSIILTQSWQIICMQIFQCGILSHKETSPTAHTHPCLPLHYHFSTPTLPPTGLATSQRECGDFSPCSLFHFFTTSKVENSLLYQKRKSSKTIQWVLRLGPISVCAGFSCRWQDLVFVKSFMKLNSQPHACN